MTAVMFPCSLYRIEEEGMIVGTQLALRLDPCPFEGQFGIEDE
ncbi:hypothetical protein AYX14_07159 [Cryptococcus neoformans]|nr:hypothetical protein AYX14_07159 [Cryptococcus neoformans var. grubii]